MEDVPDVDMDMLLDDVSDEDDAATTTVPIPDEPLTRSYLSSLRTQYRCTQVTRLAFMKKRDMIPLALHNVDVFRCYTASFYVFKDIRFGSLSIDEYQEHAREVLLTLLHGFCLRTMRAQMVKTRKNWLVEAKGNVTLELLLSEPGPDDRDRNDTDQDMRQVVGHRYRFNYFGNRTAIHQAAQKAFNTASRRPPTNTEFPFTADDSVRRWDPMNEAIRMAVEDNAELLKKIEYIQNRPLSTAIAGCVARKKEVLSLPAYSWIRYTRIDQFHNEAVLKYASSPCVCVGNLDSHPCP